METLDIDKAGTSIADRLEAQGFGRQTKPTAASVLERLRQRKPNAAPTDSNPTPSNLVNPEPVS
jgi:hypothetical protein